MKSGDLLSVLKPFCDGTTIMSGSRYPTFSHLAPLLLGVTLKINEILKSIKSSIASDIQNRYNSDQIKISLRIAMFLDPRFKDLSPFILVKEHECVYENTKTELLSVTEIGDDEIGGESEEATKINELDPPTKMKKK